MLSTVFPCTMAFYLIGQAMKLCSDFHNATEVTDDHSYARMHGSFLLLYPCAQFLLQTVLFI